MPSPVRDPTMDAEPPRLTFGQYVRHLREGRGWVQKDLVEASGLGLGTISAIENDETDPKHSTREKLAGAFGMTVLALDSGYQRFSAGPESEAQPGQLLLRRVTDKALDPIAVRLAERIQKLSTRAQNHIDGLIIAWEECEGQKRS